MNIEKIKEKIVMIIWKEEGIDYTGIMIGKYSINELKEMLEKAILKGLIEKNE